MNHFDFSAFSPLYGELWAAGENFGRQASAAAAASCIQAACKLIDVTEQRVHCPAQWQTRPVQILWGFLRSPDRFNSSAGDPRGPGTGDTSRAGVRRLVNPHLFLPHPDLERGYRSSGSDLLDQSDDVQCVRQETWGTSSTFKSKETDGMQKVCLKSSCFLVVFCPPQHREE